MSIQFNPKIQEQQLGTLGGLTINPTRVVQPQSNNPFDISIPQIHSYASDENGNRIATGQDGYGLAHKDPGEFKFHLIA